MHRLLKLTLKINNHDQLHALVVEEDMQNATGPLQIYIGCRAQIQTHYACKTEYFSYQGH